MIRNLNLTRGLIFSQTILLKLVDKGITREEAYKMVQASAMKVWNDDSKNLKDELLNSKDVTDLLSKKEIEEIFNYGKMLDNVDFIFNRTIFSG